MSGFPQGQIARFYGKSDIFLKILSQAQNDSLFFVVGLQLYLMRHPELDSGSNC